MTTHKLLQLINLNLRTMANLELGHFIIGLADAMRIHPKYQGPGDIPPPLPQIDEIYKVGTDFIALTKAADGGDRYKMAERDAMRPTAEVLPTMLMQWASIRCFRENDPGMIANLGLPPILPTVKNGVVVFVTTPEGVKAKHGKDSGTVYISTNAVPKSRTFEVGLCQGDPSQEACWSIVGPFDHCRKMVLTGLEPGKVYYFRVRCFGAGGMSPWSAIVSLRVL